MGAWIGHDVFDRDDHDIPQCIYWSETRLDA